MRPDRCWFSRLIFVCTRPYAFRQRLCQRTRAPRSVTVASNPPGTVFYALASGLAKVASEGTAFRWLSSPIPARALFSLS